MKQLITLSALGAAVLGTAAPAHAAGAGEALDPVWTLAASAESTVCRQNYSGLPVVSQYAGVVAGACGTKGGLIARAPHRA